MHLKEAGKKEMVSTVSKFRTVKKAISSKSDFLNSTSCTSSTSIGNENSVSQVFPNNKSTKSDVSDYSLRRSNGIQKIDSPSPTLKSLPESLSTSISKKDPKSKILQRNESSMSDFPEEDQWLSSVPNRSLTSDGESVLSEDNIKKKTANKIFRPVSTNITDSDSNEFYTIPRFLNKKGESSTVFMENDISRPILKASDILSQNAKQSFSAIIGPQYSFDSKNSWHKNLPKRNSETQECLNIHCRERLLKLENTITDLTNLLQQQCAVSEKAELEVRTWKKKFEDSHEAILNYREEHEAKLLAHSDNSRSLSAHPPVGYHRKSDDNIHLGRGILLLIYKYNEACNKNSISLFVKCLCDMLFEPAELKTSTITGKASNRSQKSCRNPKKLDATRVLAIKDITRYWMSQSSISEEVIDEETRNVTMYIGQKISDLHKGERPKKRKVCKDKMTQEKNLSKSDESMETEESEVAEDNEEGTFDDNTPRMHITDRAKKYVAVADGNVDDLESLGFQFPEFTCDN